MIVAIDPGQHTGMAFRFDNGEWATFLADKLPDEDERLGGVLNTLMDYLNEGKIRALVVEEFNSMGRYLSRYGIETIELVGAVKALSMVYGVVLVRQAPLHRKPFEKKAKELLRERAIQQRVHITDHEVSALSHLLRYEHMQAREAVARTGETNAT